MNHVHRQNEEGVFSHGYAPKRSSVDLIFNWIVVIAIFALTLNHFERDWSDYKRELLFYISVQDGINPADADSPYMATGIARNQEYKDSSKNSFALSQWLPKAPYYILCLAFPFLIATVRLRKRSYKRLNTLYYLGIVLFIGFSCYSMLNLIGFIP